ncbi:ABC-2 family transporter protein [Sporanaerobacter sp. PP17-6a]|jgi:ABC-type uncharacterized transport system permease subunit|uniref:ABC-2 family transporter protein n=1 Tax=Sporanaerobacter sp. PP17-6a TaxID=1891289 RepID=UPI0009F470C6|nr:hypothetical protein [Tissierellaceae bacterium]
MEFGKKPISIFPRGLQQFFTFVITALAIYNIPALYLFNKEIIFFTFALSIIWLFIAVKVWKFSLKKYYA